MRARDREREGGTWSVCVWGGGVRGGTCACV